MPMENEREREHEPPTERWGESAVGGTIFTHQHHAPILNAWEYTYVEKEEKYKKNRWKAATITQNLHQI